VASLAWNRCPVCAGMSVQFAAERVSSFGGIRNFFADSAQNLGNFGRSRGLGAGARLLVYNEVLLGRRPWQATGARALPDHAAARFAVERKAGTENPVIERIR
jgi:hypothetical protein